MYVCVVHSNEEAAVCWQNYCNILAQDLHIQLYIPELVRQQVTM